jgi:hypothetical protein
MISAFETLAAARVRLATRFEAAIGPLVHPIHATGAVFGWESSHCRFRRVPCERAL